MTERGKAYLEAIDRSLRCPDCEYPLLGLPGNDVTCPECGRTCNRLKLIAARLKDWKMSREYRLVCAPSEWAVYGIIVCLLVTLPFVMFGIEWFMVAPLTYVFVWILLARRARGICRGKRFVKLLALSHLANVFFLAPFTLTLGAIIATGILADRASWWNSFNAFIFIMVSSVLLGSVLVLKRRWKRFLDEFIHARCLALSLGPTS